MSFVDLKVVCVLKSLHYVPQYNYDLVILAVKILGNQNT